jgi:hypothetical protein
MIQFKDYILLTEWTRELMPEIYAALEKYDDPMVGVHFSKGVEFDRKRKKEEYVDPKKKEYKEHLGLNLNPSHYDPIGIYAFPKDYVLKGGLNRNTGFSERPYWYIVKPSSKARILNLSKLTYDEAHNLLIKMGIDTPNGESRLDSKEIYHNFGNDIGHRFWGALEHVRKHMAIEHRNLSWNVLFKDSGYNVLYDEGDKIIHSNEPYQIVYLDSSAMEVLDQGKQGDGSIKIYSFFVENFPELRARKQKEYNSFYLKLFSENYMIYVYPPSNDQIRIQVLPRNTDDYNKKIDTYIDLKDLNNDFIAKLKEDISQFEKTLTPMEKKTFSMLEKISERFNIKLKKDDIGDLEIRQRYQDVDDSFLITFYITSHKNKIFFVLKKSRKDKGYGWYGGYHHAVEFEYSEDSSPEQIVTTGLNLLKERASEGHPDMAYRASQTIELLRKRVFRL